MTLIKNIKYATLDDGSEDGMDVLDTEYLYYDDNLDLAGWVTKRVETDTGNFIAFIDFIPDQEFGKIRYCEHCLEFDIKHKLGAAPNHEEKLKCFSCGNVYPLHQHSKKQHLKRKKNNNRNNRNMKEVTIF